MKLQSRFYPNKNPPSANEALNTSSNLSLPKRQSFSVFLSVYCKKGYRVKRSAQCNVIQRVFDSGFYPVDSGFYVCVFRIPHRRIPDSTSGWIPDFKMIFWIPDPISWIPDSTDQNYLDSGLPYMGRKRLLV